MPMAQTLTLTPTEMLAVSAPWEIRPLSFTFSPPSRIALFRPRAALLRLNPGVCIMFHKLLTAFTPAINVVNLARTDLGCDPVALCSALDRYIAEQLSPIWNVIAHVFYSNKTSSRAWNILLLDDGDQAGALGYHSDTLMGRPFSKVFVKDTLAADGYLSGCVSHEAVEMLVDPGCNLSAGGPNGRHYAVEIADPVQRSTVEVDGFKMSSFVTPAWFQPWADGTMMKMDLLNEVQRPFTLARGGYISYLDPVDGQWHQTFACRETAKAFWAKSEPGKRPMRRARFHIRAMKERVRAEAIKDDMNTARE